MTDVEFEFDFDKALAALLYLAKKKPRGFGKYHACKLLFLADKYHLVKYGRTISGDRYFALPQGPIPTTILDLINALLQEAGSDDVEALRAAFEVKWVGEYAELRASEEPNWDCLSRSDIEALDETLKRHGDKSFWQLWDLTHAMEAYRRAWDNRGPQKRALMAFEDFFEGDKDAVEGVLDEVIEDCEIRKVFPVVF